MPQALTLCRRWEDHEWLRGRDGRRMILPAFLDPDGSRRFMVSAVCAKCQTVTMMDIADFERLTRKG